MPFWTPIKAEERTVPPVKDELPPFIRERIIRQKSDESINFCPYCGAKVRHIDAKFCSSCGKSLSDD